MRYVSLFSGIEAASVAWGPLGWEPIAFSEIDVFPCAVLADRFPDVPNLGDITKIDWEKVVKTYGKPDVVVGGSPCQSFSVAGRREGLSGASGLMWEYVRCVREIMPDWVVWENVPGALSSSHGEDFRCLLEALDTCGYGLAWRVLDAQFFGVAQRRERLFLVGHLGDVRACEVLFEPESLSWDTSSSREKRQELAGGTGSGAARAVFCLGDAASNASIDRDLAGTLKANNDCNPPIVSQYGDVRRLTPRECERLQGMPDDWTLVPWRDRPAEKCPDGPRYKAIGNSMAVPVMRWIGERIGGNDVR